MSLEASVAQLQSELAAVEASHADTVAVLTSVRADCRTATQR